jgi:hypothetical protein
MLKHTLPKWNDEKGVARLANEILAELESNPFLDFANNVWARDADDFDKFERAEAVAVEAAKRKRKNAALLAKLLQDEHWDWMQPATRQLIAEILLGKRYKVGTPKKTAEERRRMTPTHRAAAEFNLLKRGLAKSYPEIDRAAVRERALNIAAKRTGVSPRTLENYVDRPKKDRRRISH